MKIAGKTLLSYYIGAAFYSAPLIAGGVGGGGPPAISELELLLQTEGSAGLFTNEAGKIGLGVRGEIGEEMRLSSVGTAGFRIDTSDLKLMSDHSIKSIDAVSLGNEGYVSNSYRVVDGNKTGELILKDRRTLIREDVKN